MFFFIFIDEHLGIRKATKQRPDIVMRFPTLLQLGLFVALSVAFPQHDKRDFSVGQGVQTSSGVVFGKSASEKTQVSEYLGIPFAQPPVGNLRFAAPQAYVGSGTVNATSFVSTLLESYVSLADGRCKVAVRTAKTVATIVLFQADFTVTARPTPKAAPVYQQA